MKAQLECVYRGIKEIPEGKFTNEKGEIIQYSKHYKIKIDQNINGLPTETQININQQLAMTCAKSFDLYDPIVITFNIIIYSKQNVVFSIDNIRKIS